MAVKLYPEIDKITFGGTGKDGIFDPQSSYDYSDSEGSWVVKEYTSVNIDNGITVSATNRIKGIIWFVSGNVIINGEVDLDGKGYGADDGDIIPSYYANYSESGVLKNAISEKCSTTKGGDGGGGGGGGYYSGSTSSNASNGDKAGGAPRDSAITGNIDADGWKPGLNVTSGNHGIGGTFNADPYTTVTYYGGGGGGGHKGTKACGGHGGGGGGGGYATSSSALCHGGTASLVAKGTNGTKAQGNCGDGGTSGYSGGGLIIICAGNLTFGSTANIHCDGANGTNGGNATSASYSSGGGGGGGGGGVQIYLYQGALSLDGAATRTVSGGTGGTGGTIGATGSDAGSGSIGTITTQQIPRN